MKLSEFKKKISEELLEKIKRVFGLKSPSIDMRKDAKRLIIRIEKIIEIIDIELKEANNEIK